MLLVYSSSLYVLCHSTFRRLQWGWVDSHLMLQGRQRSTKKSINLADSVVCWQGHFVDPWRKGASQFSWEESKRTSQPPGLGSQFSHQGSWSTVKFCPFQGSRPCQHQAVYNWVQVTVCATHMLGTISKEHRPENTTKNTIFLWAPQQAHLHVLPFGPTFLLLPSQNTKQIVSLLPSRELTTTARHGMGFKTPRRT